MISIYSNYWKENIYHSKESFLPKYDADAHALKGFPCCSNEAISFNGLTPTQMYLFEYLLYHMSVFKDSDQGFLNRNDVDAKVQRPKDPVISYG